MSESQPYCFVWNNHRSFEISETVRPFGTENVDRPTQSKPSSFGKWVPRRYEEEEENHIDSIVTGDEP